MASGELFIDLEYKRYAEIPVTAPRPESLAAGEQSRAERQAAGIARLRARAAQHDELARDVLAAMGLDE